MAFKPQFPRKECLWWSLRANVFLEEYNPEGSEEEGEMDVSQRRRKTRHKCYITVVARA